MAVLAEKIQIERGIVAQMELITQVVEEEDHIHDPGEDYSMGKDMKFLSEHQNVHKKSSSEGHKRQKKHRTEGTSIRQKGEDSSDEQEKSERKRKSKSPESHIRHKKHRAEDTSISKLGETSFDEQEKSERKLESKSHEQCSKEWRSSDQGFDYTDDNRGRRDSRSGDKSYSRHDIDTQIDVVRDITPMIVILAEIKRVLGTKSELTREEKQTVTGKIIPAVVILAVITRVLCP